MLWKRGCVLGLQVRGLGLGLGLGLEGCGLVNITAFTKFDLRQLIRPVESPIDPEATPKYFSRSLVGKSRSLFSLSELFRDSVHRTT